MATLTHGMNIAAVRTSMSKINTYAAQIESLKNSLNTEITNLLTIWSGKDANTFVNTTWPPFKTNLASLVTSLRLLATTGNNQASQQETTSAA